MNCCTWCDTTLSIAVGMSAFDFSYLLLMIMLSCEFRLKDLSAGKEWKQSTWIPSLILEKSDRSLWPLKVGNTLLLFKTWNPLSTLSLINYITYMITRSPLIIFHRQAFFRFSYLDSVMKVPSVALFTYKTSTILKQPTSHEISVP